jgi:hypothetical protein
MKMRPEVKPALWGAAGGAVALAIIGFTWGGWMTAGAAEQMSKKSTDSAVVSILAKICVEQFNARATDRLTELSELKSYEQAGFIEKGGWATMPGSDEPVTGVARSCAAMLTEPA